MSRRPAERRRLFASTPSGQLPVTMPTTTTAATSTTGWHDDPLACLLPVMDAPSPWALHIEVAKALLPVATREGRRDT